MKEETKIKHFNLQKKKNPVDDNLCKTVASMIAEVYYLQNGINSRIKKQKELQTEINRLRNHLDEYGYITKDIDKHLFLVKDQEK